MKTILFSICLLFFVTNNLLFAASKVDTQCLSLYRSVKVSHEWAFGIGYPSYFSLAQIKKETNCTWITSKDGYGSIGYGQITPKFWEEHFKKLNLVNYKQKDSMDHFKAQAYINKNAYDSITNLCIDKTTKTKKLWAMYQGYNGSPYTLNKEIQKAKACVYELSKKQCNRGIMCVWYDKDGKTCKQYRDRCDINYSYSKILFQYGNQFATYVGEKYVESASKYKFW